MFLTFLLFSYRLLHLCSRERIVKIYWRRRRERPSHSNHVVLIHPVHWTFGQRRQPAVAPCPRTPPGRRRSSGTDLLPACSNTTPHILVLYWRTCDTKRHANQCWGACTCVGWQETLTPLWQVTSGTVRLCEPAIQCAHTFNLFVPHV